MKKLPRSRSIICGKMYELTYNRAMELRNENLTDVAKMKKRIQELKGEIRALGNVNVNAIEDYKNVSERYEFLKTQHDDLVEAEATLEKIIAELDEAMRKRSQSSSHTFVRNSTTYLSNCSEVEKVHWN